MKTMISIEALQIRGSTAFPFGEMDPLYLLTCFVWWRSKSNDEAGWELLGALTSFYPNSRDLAEAVCAKLQ